MLKLGREVARLSTRRSTAIDDFWRYHRPYGLARTIVTTRYTKDHEAIAYDDQTKLGSVRITKHAQESLGDIVFVELPVQSTTVKQGDQIGAVESVKAASDIYAPVSGEVTDINGKLGDKPGILGSDDDDTNWLCKIKLSDPSEFDVLMTEEEYKTHCESGS